MNSKLSQAERTAMEAAIRNIPRSRGSAPGFEDGWLAARDYGRERERALEEAHAVIARSPLSCAGCTDVASAALAASQPEVLSERNDTEPGEPEGQSDERRGEMEMAAMVCFQTPWQKVSPAYRAAYEHAWLNALQAQPAHGPGEPSEDEGRFFADRLLAEQFHATLPNPHRWSILDLPTGGYLLVGESNG